MNEFQNSRPDDASELDWLAFRYVAGECDPAEMLEFELRLADDQVAREAVARAVELAQVCASACRVETSVERVAPASRGAWFLPAVWTTCGAAAALAVVALVTSLWPRIDDVHPSGPTARNGAVDPAVASAWLESVGEVPAAAHETEGESNYLAELTVDSESSESPSWMLAAVESELMGDMPAPETPDEG